ncbi:hypothetical protein GCM10010285_46280 [Streptomyces pseudogriseolus]|uniref:Lipoprotein n=1 Tax=Streptomyces pseudogriseolus TaxID=36817 RepID=A0ABQ2TEX2_STREZ|nr:hypothetical protein GCM10010285_46280 [Streptomyces rubiginosus]
MVTPRETTGPVAAAGDADAHTQAVVATTVVSTLLIRLTACSSLRLRKMKPKTNSAHLPLVTHK